MRWFTKNDSSDGLHDTILRVFAESGIIGEVLDDGALRAPDGTVYGFVGLTEHLSGLPAAEHRAAILAYIDQIHRNTSTPMPTTVAEAGTSLLPRILHSAAFPDPIAVELPLVGPLRIVPAIDLPDSVVTLTNLDSFGGWEQAWPAAMANLRALPDPALQTFATGDERPATVHAFVSDDFFGATRLLDLDHLLDRMVGPAERPRHTLVVLPNRSLLAVTVLDSAEVNPAISALLSIGADYLDQPGSLVADVFYRSPDGVLQPVSSRDEQGRVSIEVAGRFADALRELGTLDRT